MFRVALLIGALATLCSCSWFGPQIRQAVAPDHRPVLVLLPARLEATISKASQVESVPDDLSSEEDQRRAADAVQAIRSETRRIFFEKLENGEQFRPVPLEDIDAAVRELGLTQIGRAHV